MMKSISAVIVTGMLLMVLLSGCHGQFDPQKNLLSSRCFGWWYAEIPPTDIVPGHLMYVSLTKDGAVLFDYAPGFGTRAIGAYSFHEGSKRNQGSFDLYLAGKTLHSEQFLGNWNVTFDYKRTGLGYQLVMVTPKQRVELKRKYKERDEQLIMKELDTALQEFLKRTENTPGQSTPANTPR